MSLGALWILTGGLLVATIATFLWAKGSSGGGRRSVRFEKTVTAQPQAKRARIEVEQQAGPYPPAPASASAPGGEAAVADSRPNALAWATFGVSAFGTLSSFVFSLLTYLRAE